MQYPFTGGGEGVKAFFVSFTYSTGYQFHEKKIPIPAHDTQEVEHVYHAGYTYNTDGNSFTNRLPRTSC